MYVKRKIPFVKSKQITIIRSLFIYQLDSDIKKNIYIWLKIKTIYVLRRKFKVV